MSSWSTPPISVIIPSHVSCADFLGAAVESVLAQDVPEAEIVVVDDGLNDFAAAVARHFATRVRLIRQSCRGVSSARNAGARAATGLYLALLDADDLLVPDSLRVRADYLVAHPSVALVCGDAEVFGVGGPLGLHSAWRGKPRHPHDVGREILAYTPLPSTVMLRRTCFDSGFAFDEVLPRAGAEDWLLWIQLSAFYRLAYLDRVVARYRRHALNASANERYIEANHCLALARLAAWPGFAAIPRQVRARLLYQRAASAWRSERRSTALGLVVRAVCTDPAQISFGLFTVREGLRNARRRHAISA